MFAQAQHVGGVNYVQFSHPSPEALLPRDRASHSNVGPKTMVTVSWLHIPHIDSYALGRSDYQKQLQMEG